MSTPQNPPFQTALLAGAVAGTTVDLTLFPLDTLKTRLQSSAGFFPSGGFTGIYRGVGSALVGSAPGAAFFFCTYETIKSLSDEHLFGRGSAWGHMLAGSAGEVAACAVRVPTEVVKQRAQAGLHGGRSAEALKAILRTKGAGRMWRELYRGWGITVFREVPFTVIQFPIWEALKRWGRERRDLKKGVTSKGEDVPALESAIYGSLAGAIAAGLTTPLDVLKTRVMLAEKRVSMGSICGRMLREEGWRPFFAGLAPRTMWISIGGFIFLGSYQWVVNTMTKVI